MKQFRLASQRVEKSSQHLFSSQRTFLIFLEMWILSAIFHTLEELYLHAMPLLLTSVDKAQTGKGNEGTHELFKHDRRK